MNIAEKSHTDEINSLLAQIDKYTIELANVEAELDSERKTRARLELRLEMIEKNKLDQTRQQTRIMRKQEEVVRDLSCELDHVSKRLRKSVKASFSWGDKVKELKGKLDESEQMVGDLREKLARTEEKLKKQNEELRDAKTIVELYEQLKVQSRTEEVRLNRQRKSIYQKAKEIYTSYRNVQKEMSKNDEILREKLTRSAVLPVKGEETREKGLLEEEKEREEDKRLKAVERRMNVFKTENAFLKKKIIGFLNQYCAELPNTQSQMSEVELSFYQKSVRKKPKRSTSGLPINARKSSICQLMTSRKKDQSENSLFKINTLKISKPKNLNSGEKKIFLGTERLGKAKVDFVKSSRHLFESKKRLEEEDKKEAKKRNNSTKSDLMSSNKLKISCIETSNVIGGKTFHIISQNNVRKISKNSEQDKKQFISTNLFNFGNYKPKEKNLKIIRRPNHRNNKKKSTEDKIGRKAKPARNN